MIRQIKTVLGRSDTLIKDLAGAMALFVLLMGGLYLPGF